VKKTSKLGVAFRRPLLDWPPNASCGFTTVPIKHLSPLPGPRRRPKTRATLALNASTINHLSVSYLRGGN